jgi:tRNA dimethylallyltransferase
VNNHGGPAVALVGTTASGKSALAHGIARNSKDVDIVCVDSMTVYRGMDIGTAKPSIDEQAEVNYHLLDIIDPWEEFTVAQFQHEAREVTESIWNLGGAVLYVGGTGLYGRAIIDNLDIPGQFPDVRRSLEERKDELELLFKELEALDPIAASRMEVTNERRVLRALEVTIGSGRPFSSYGNGLMNYGPVRVVQIGIDKPLDEIDTNIDDRFRLWMEQGFLQEVESLLDSPKGLSRTAAQAVGYRELAWHLTDGMDLGFCVQSAITATKRLARRQRSWFRRDPRIEWFQSPQEAAERIQNVLSSPDGFVRN